MDFRALGTRDQPDTRNSRSAQERPRSAPNPRRPQDLAASVADVWTHRKVRRPSAIRQCPGAYPGRYKEIMRASDQEPRVDHRILMPEAPRSKVHAKASFYKQGRKPPTKYGPDDRISSYTLDFPDRSFGLPRGTYDKYKEGDGRLCLDKSRRHYGSHGEMVFRPNTAPAYIRPGIRRGHQESLASETEASEKSRNYSLKEGFTGHMPNSHRNRRRYGKTYGKACDPRSSQSKEVCVVDNVGTYPHVHICTPQTIKDAGYYHPCHF